ncbi:MAG: transposase [Planctomycetota bacterium]
MRKATARVLAKERLAAVGEMMSVLTLAPRSRNQVKRSCHVGLRPRRELSALSAQCSVLSSQAIYVNDAVAKERRLSTTERLVFHQATSGPVMEKLHEWLQAQFDEKKVEPNSGLGEAIQYMLKHWEPLTLFLREPGASLDNNLCERVLKMAIRYRENSLFYKTERGARVGDLFMSLIHTCRLNGENAFHYLTTLLRHPGGLSRNPRAWMPWNYRATLKNLDSS